MMKAPNTAHTPAKGSFARRRKALAAGTVAMGVAGLLATEMFIATPTPANAENLSAGVSQQHAPGFADIVERVSPAVVSIRVKSESGPELSSFQGMPEGSPFERFFKQFEDQFGGQQQMPRGRGAPGGGKAPHQFSMGQGSGFIISSDGYVVTNNHVVDHAEEVTVVMNDGKTYTAKVIGTDEKTDLALVKIEGEESFPFVAFTDGDVRVGDWVVAVGNPFGLGGSVTAGIVSARGREIGAGPYDDFLQIDAPINKGNSGGPTFNLDGKVVGVNTAIYSPSGGSVGIGFAIPASIASQVIEDLKDDGTVTRGWLGVQIQPITPDIADSLGLEGIKGALVAQPLEDVRLLVLGHLLERVGEPVVRELVRDLDHALLGQVEQRRREVGRVQLGIGRDELLRRLDAPRILVLADVLPPGEGRGALRERRCRGLGPA